VNAIRNDRAMAYVKSGTGILQFRFQNVIFSERRSSVPAPPTRERIYNPKTTISTEE